MVDFHAAAVSTDHADVSAAAATAATAGTDTRFRTGKRAVSPTFTMEGFILFELTSQPGAQKVFSAPCMRTIVDLHILGATGYERSRLTFSQIRGELAAKTGDPSVTVPTLELGDGSHLTESWRIAEYLATKHPAGHLLFPSPTVKRLAALYNEMGASLLAPHLRPLCIPNIAAMLDESSKAYFIQRKIGSARFEKSASMPAEERESHIEAAVKVLATVEAALACSGSRSTRGHGHELGGSQWLASTEMPSHADACLYGWYVYSRTAGAAVTKALWHTEHPNLSRWVNDMNDWLGQEVTSNFV
ncbi:unnamed protein product [Parajaminaea phylloscopi]